VRLSNEAAQALYAGLGFAVTGRRKEYYTPLPGSREREDALLMTFAL
jgi:ribosomal protein S18 acetylase RimI-like enzyme